MDTKCAPPYALVTIGSKEKETLFKVDLPKYFALDSIQTIKLYFKRNMGEGFVLLWPSFLSFDNFCTCLSGFHPSVRFSFKKAEIVLSQRE